MDELERVRVDIHIGSLEFAWASNGRLERIQILDFAEDLEDPCLKLQGAKLGATAGTAPSGWEDWLEKFKSYILLGEPLGEVPWSLIEQAKWTSFQREVYQVITKIPHGETRSYAWVAEKIKKFGACQAVGQALRNNPIPVLIPCHRVVPKMGGLGGFMGKKDHDQPEIHLKGTLLKLEDRYRNPEFPFLKAQ